jgi:hypothetical protein
MKTSFWAKRFALTYLLVFFVLFATALLRERAPRRALAESLLWAGITSGIFIGTRAYHSGKGRQCTLCRSLSGLEQEK